MNTPQIPNQPLREALEALLSLYDGFIERDEITHEAAYHSFYKGNHDVWKRAREALAGGEQSWRCPKCGGRPQEGAEKCQDCDPVEDWSSAKPASREIGCGTCDGTGLYGISKCPDCNGSGKEKRRGS